MEFDFSSVDQKPNHWFSTQIVYEGEGQAEFANPQGIVRGHTVASFEENGQFHIEMIVKGIQAEIELPLGLHQLLSADEPIEDGNTLKLGYPPNRPNTCNRLTIKTTDGTFLGESILDVTISMSTSFEGITEKLIFHPRTLWFDVDNPNAALYWSVPLINCMVDFVHKDESLGRHPLRIYPTSILPENIPEDERETANFIARQRSKLIVFGYQGGKGFIEGLPDYKNRLEKLKCRQVPHTITAIMVVPLLEKSFEPVDVVDEWFPRHLIYLLEIATGIEIEAPWIEFRDLYGNLVRRIHRIITPPLFLQGIKVLDELFVARGIGSLLEASQHSGFVHETFFRVALRHTVLAGRNEQILEDKLDHLCRALETLCEHYGFKTQNLLAHTKELDCNTIHQELATVISTIEKLRQQALIDGDLAQTRLLDTIRGRINNVANQDRKFGLAVCDLLSKFGFFDADVIDKFYAVEPRKDGLRNWADVITKYRGSVIHSGFFNILGGDIERYDVFIVIRHLHDILVRIIFTLLGYTGNYLPELMGGHQATPVNWVQVNTPVEYLGYKKLELGPLMIVSVIKDEGNP